MSDENKTIIEAVREVKTSVEGKFTEQGNRLKGIEDAQTKAGNEIIELRTHLDQVRKAQLATKREFTRSRHNQQNQVSVECARHLAGIAISARLRSGKDVENKSRLEGIAKDILGAEFKTALSSSDIPLPVDYSGEVVELVSAFGAARQYGTVYPLGTGTTKLPRLKTDTAFGLLSQSTAITEKSPQTEWVTFAPEKFGGLIRVPTELDEDSIVSIGQFIARYAARQIASVEDQVFFLNLDGSTYGAVEGLCASTITNSKKFQMASTNTAYDDSTLTNWRNVRQVVDAAALGSSAYYCHPSFEQHLNTFNSAGDKPYMANGIQGASLDGFPIRWVDKMPAWSTSANASKVFALFGDLSYQYLGVRGGIRFDQSADAAFTTDEILIRSLERFTIGLMATGAVAGLQTAAS